MQKNFNVLLGMLCAISLHSSPLTSQTQSSKNFTTPVGTMKLSGTSTLHDWDMNGAFQVQGKFKIDDASNKLLAVNELSFKLPVENLKSDKTRLDETAYKALKTDQYKDIQFTMTSSTITNVQSNKYFITAVGKLTIAGVTHPIIMNVCWQLNNDKTITCSGIQNLRMTEFEVKPPSFLGFMKAGDDIALDFSFQIKE